MKDETDRSPIGQLLDARDMLAHVGDLLELLNLAGNGMGPRDPSGSAITRGAIVAQEAVAVIGNHLQAATDGLRKDPGMTAPAFPETRLGRLAFIAETLGIAAPAGLGPDLLGDDAAPHPAVLAFCHETGASLDFIYRGDIRPMLWGDFNCAREGAASVKGEAA